MGLPEDEVELAGVIIEDRQRDGGPGGLPGEERCVDRPTGDELARAQHPPVRREEPIQLVDVARRDAGVGLDFGVNGPG